MESTMHDVNWRLPDHDGTGGYLCEGSPPLDFCGFFDFAERTSEDSFHSVGGVSAFLQEEAKLHEAVKLPQHGFDPKSEFYEDNQEMFDMSAFFRQDFIPKNNEHISPFAKAFDESPVDLDKEPMHERTSSSMDELTNDTSSIDSVVMGIPYYVACQWQHMQQQQQQQQQAVMMLWWQAYLSGAYNMCGPKGTPAATPLGWSLPSVAFQGACANFGEDMLYQHLFEDKSHHGGTKRRRKNDGNDPIGKKGRRQKHDERVCKNCGTNETPFWRKDKQDGHPLCNACGLYLSKNDTPRPKVLWKSGEKPSSSTAAPASLII